MENPPLTQEELVEMREWMNENETMLEILS